MRHKFIKYIILLLLFNSCGKNKVTLNDMDNFILKYECEDFSVFKNYTIAIRQKTFTETIYIIRESDPNVDSVPSFIYVNNFTSKISEIKAGSTKKLKSNQDLNNTKIKNLISKYKKYDFPYLSVDNNNNICVNPFYVDLRPYFFHLKIKSDKKQIVKNLTVFKHYKNNWYVREY